MGDAELVHRVERAPSLALHVEEVHFAISVGVLSTDQNDLSWGDGQGRAGPERVLHTDREDNPSVLIDIIDLDRIVDLLLRAAKEASKRINELIIDSARAQVMPLVFHDGHLGPFVRLDLVLFDRVQALLATEATEDVDVSAAHRDSVRVSTLVHRALVRDLISLGQVEPSILLGWRTATSNQDVRRGEGDGRRALIELALAAIRQLFDRPLILVNVVAQAYLRIHIVAEKVYARRLVLCSLLSTNKRV